MEPRRVPDVPHEPAAPVVLVDLARRYGGVEGRVMATARGLADHVPVMIVCLRDSPLHHAAQQAGLPITAIPHGRGDPRVITRLRALLAVSPRAIVDAHNVQSQLWSILATRRSPDATLVASVHSQYRQEQQGRRRAPWYELVLRLLGHRGAAFIAVSDSVRNYLEELGIDRQRIAVVWNAVQVPDTVHGDRKAIRRSVGVNPDDFAVVTVARVTHIKGHHVFLEAVGALRDELPHLRWLVVGDGPAQEELQEHAARVGLGDHVRWLGFRGDVPALLKASDCIALPSLSEGLPLALLEAAGQRVPILATRVGAVPDVFEHGCTARLVPPGEPEALAAELRWLAAHTEERARLAAAAAEAVAERLDTTAMVDGILAAYDRFRVRSDRRVSRRARRGFRSVSHRFWGIDR